jgi:ATP-dependent DNA ligase
MEFLRAVSASFIVPCLPISARQPPSGELRLHEIKHDGLRVMAHKDGSWVRLFSRKGNDLTKRFQIEPVPRACARAWLSDCAGASFCAPVCNVDPRVHGI